MLSFPVPRKKILLTCAIIYLLSQMLFLINIQFPRGYNFDEFHYVPSAKQFLELKKNQNWEHPPLGKEIIAAGIALWGDRPIGWRFMSTVFGSLTLIAFYLLGLSLFKSQRSALLVVALTLFNNLLYVQARIGMLDTFMFAFTAWAMVGFFASWEPNLPLHVQRWLLAFTGVMLGLATATKWWAVIPWVLCFGLLVIIRLLQYWKTSFGGTDQPDPREWYHPDLWKDLRLLDIVLWLGVVPTVVYCLTFVPLLLSEGAPLSLKSIFEMQKKMYDGQLRVTTAHPYMSTWSDWATLKRPIWYAFDKEEPNDSFVRGVVLLGNPLIMWTGLVAVVSCIWSWLTTRRRDVFLISVFYCAFYFCWLAIPRKVSFYYYYYPAGMLLSLALVSIFQQAQVLSSKRDESVDPHPMGYVFAAASLVVFAFFFPILAALRIPTSRYELWMVFRTWI